MAGRAAVKDRNALFGDIIGSVPNVIEQGSFISARVDEIEALNLAISLGDPSKKGMVFQQLPKHMRRRIMSHTIKRMPRRLREAHTRSLIHTGALNSKLKRPSRKYRRRPSNLLQEYNRRQRNFIWLETHIWHAKRFHMTKKWGYNLADRPNDKNYRACYRAAANHCLLQDLSYFNCIELLGPYNILVSSLKHHTSTECGLTFAAKCLSHGTRAGKVMFFEKNRYPFGAIGRVDFLWKYRNNESENSNSVLWLWCHPSFYKEILHQLISTFDLEETLEISDSDKPMNEEESVPKRKKKKKSKSVEKSKLESKNTPFLKVPKYRSSDGSVKMNLLKDTLNRFRLIGPLSNAVLTSAFSLANFKMSETSLDSEEDLIGFDWWVKFYKTQERIESLSAQSNFWSLLKTVSSPSQLPPHSIISINIIDPRLTLPSARIKAGQNSGVLSSGQPPVTKIDPLCCVSPLWNSNVRDKVTETKLSTAELIKKRANRVVPGISVEEDKLIASSRIPILLIQRPGIQSDLKRIGFGSGWDLIIPAGWGMPVWLGLVFRGCRTGGLRETFSLSREMGIPLFDEPDTKVGFENNEIEKNSKLDFYFRRPPAKRLNFFVLGIPTPYDFQWQILINEWISSSTLQCEKSSSSQDSFYVLRSRIILDQLSKFLSLNEVKTKKLIKKISKLLIQNETLPNCLVPVNILLSEGGKLEKYSLICLPNETDFSPFTSRNNQKRKRGKTEIQKEIMETKHADHNFEERKKFREMHKKLLSKLRRKRIAVKKKKREENAKCSLSELKIVKKKKKAVSPTAQLVATYNQEMRKLWLPSKNIIKDSNCRSIMGFITNGAFSFSEALSFGQGYVTLLSYLELVLLLNKNNVGCAKVLVRNYSSYYYRFANISIMLS